MGYNSILSFLNKELIIISRDKIQIIFELILPIASLLPSILYSVYLSEIYGLSDFALRTGTDQYFKYMACGVVFFIFLTIQEQIGNFLITEMRAGTLEQIWITPSSKWNLIFGYSIVASFRGILYGAISTIGVLFLGGNVIGMMAINDVSITLLSLFFFSINSFSFGMILCSITLKYRQADAIIFFITNLVPILSGITYPINVLPKFVQSISLMLPVTYCMDLLRNGVLGSELMFNSAYEILILIFSSIIYLIIGMNIYIKTCKRVEKCGTIYMM